MLKITERLRKILSEPQGKLYEGVGEEPVVSAVYGRRYSLLACVGDMVSYYALKAKIFPDILVFDGRSVRRDVADIKREIVEMTRSYVEILARNPPGCITEDLVEKVFKAIELVKGGRRVRIFVEGEEDLAVMPLAVVLPKGSLIVYGQPGRGVVALDVGLKRRDVIGYLEMMDVVNGSTLEKLRRWSDGDTC